MTFVIAVLTTIALLNGAATAAPAEETPPAKCDVPEWLLPADADLTRVSNEINDRHRLDISVVGSGSSALSGPDGARFAYPAQLEQSLRERLPGIEIKVTAHVQPRQTTADMASGLQKILAEDQPALVIWQAGTVDALGGVGLRISGLHVNRTPAGVLENLRVAALGKSGRAHQFDLSEPFGRGQPAAGEEPVAAPAGAAGGGRT